MVVLPLYVCFTSNTEREMVLRPVSRGPPSDVAPSILCMLLVILLKIRRGIKMEMING